MRYLTIAFLAATACGQPSASSHDDLATAMDRYVEGGRVAGVVTMIVKRGETVHEHAAGFRDVESNDPIEVTDLFRIASQSKAVTSVAAMILVEEGRLSLDDALAHFIPEFANTRVAVEQRAGYSTVPLAREITIRHLMTHTSGISYGWGPAQAAFDSAGIVGWYLANRDEPIQEFARRLAHLPLRSQPGERFVYGWSTDVLGAVVEIASGQPLDRFLRERIFDQLAMDDTYFFVPENQSDRLVTVYGMVGAELQRMPDGSVMQSQGDYVRGPRKCFSGGAGLISSAPDFVRFQLMLLNGGILDGHRILSAASVTDMTTDRVGDLYSDGVMGFGLGFRIHNRRSRGPEPAGAYSWDGAYHSHFWIDPANDLVGIILTQLIPSQGIDIHQQFKKLVYEAVNQRREVN